MKLDINTLIDEVIDREGGYSNHPADRGGETRWGITIAVARQFGYTGEMRKYPRDTAAQVYQKTYWVRPGFDRVAAIYPRLGAELFDTGINMGPPVAAGFLQRALNALNRNATDYRDIVVDRRIGNATIAVLQAFASRRGIGGEDVMLKAVEALQGARYLELAEARPANEAFLYGWLANRIGQTG